MYESRHLYMCRVHRRVNTRQWPDAQHNVLCTPQTLHSHSGEANKTGALTAKNIVKVGARSQAHVHAGTATLSALRLASMQASAGAALNSDSFTMC